MLHRLEIENFYSIRERQVIDLRAAANARNDDGRLTPLWDGAAEKVPKIIALFGANASGKSNVLRALYFVAWFIQNSFSHPPGAGLPFEPFHSTEGHAGPTYLTVHFSGIEDFNNPDAVSSKFCRYAYELVLSSESSKTVICENLYYWPSFASRRLKLFERDAQCHVTSANSFDLKGYQQAIDKVLRPNASVVSTLAQLGHAFSIRLREVAAKAGSNILIEKGDYADEFVIAHYANNSVLAASFNQVLERIDAGITALRFEQGAKGPIAMFTHQGLSAPLPLLYESHGTRQFMKLYPILFYALQKGGIAIIDELDSALHPVLLAEVLGWFHTPELNPNNAQLWTSCQNASVLEDLVKEEVFFCEKDKSGQTRLYGLGNIKAARRGDNYYKKYLGGSYGAIPQIG